MKFLKSKITRLLAITTLSSCTLIPTLAHADEIDRPYLDYIANAISTHLQNMDQNLTIALNTLSSWLLPDTSDTTATVQANFSNYTLSAEQNEKTRDDLQQQLTSDFLGSDVTPLTLPYANEMTFQTLLGKPYFSKKAFKNLGITLQTTSTDPDSAAYQYLKNIAGLNITHAIPNSAWQGSSDSIQKYKNYYTTISAVQTYNAYIASELYAEYKNGGSFSSLQNTLIQQASNSDWFAKIASENIGFVLRQLLMYTSQQLVVSSEILKSEREMVAAQTMTNTLVIIGNQFNEKMLYNNATTK